MASANSPYPASYPASSAGTAHAGIANLTGLTRLEEMVSHADPHAAYERLRAEWGDVAPIELEPGVHAWLVMGYDELCQVLRDESSFPRDPAAHWRDYAEGRIRPDSPLGPMMFPRPNALFADGDEHHRLREPLDDVEKALPQRRTGRQARTVCASLIRGLADRGQADLIADYALMIPTLVMGQMLGLDAGAARELFRAQIAMVRGDENSHAGSQRFAEILTGLVQARAARPSDDLTTVIAAHPNFRDDSERVQSVVLMVSAAAEATMAWIAGTLLLMLADERFNGQMRGGMLGIDEALEEVLWRDPPMANFPARFAGRDLTLGKTAIRKGDALILGFAAANADPRARSDKPWNEIGNRAQLSWGTGPHACPAQLPARIIVRTAVETALNGLPGLRLAAAPGELGRIGAPWTHCPAILPVTFTPPDPAQPPATVRDRRPARSQRNQIAATAS